MIGYESKRAAAQAKVEGPLHVVCQCDKCKAQPAQEPNWAWACNECGAQEYTSALCEADLDYLACSNCGGDEFHKEALAQPAQKPVGFVDSKLNPIQRPWVGLTDEEIDVIYEQHHNQYGECESPNFGYERAIEAKLKEKNFGN